MLAMRKGGVWHLQLSLDIGRHGDSRPTLVLFHNKKVFCRSLIVLQSGVKSVKLIFIEVNWIALERRWTNNTSQIKFPLARKHRRWVLPVSSVQSTSLKLYTVSN